MKKEKMDVLSDLNNLLLQKGIMASISGKVIGVAIEEGEGPVLIRTGWGEEVEVRIKESTKILYMPEYVRLTIDSIHLNPSGDLWFSCSQGSNG